MGGGLELVGLEGLELARGGVCRKEKPDTERASPPARPRLFNSLEGEWGGGSLQLASARA